MYKLSKVNVFFVQMTGFSHNNVNFVENYAL